MTEEATNNHITTDDGRRVWGGAVVGNDAEFVHAAVNLYTNPEHWVAAQSTASALLESLCGGPLDRVLWRLSEAVRCVDKHRQEDFVRGVLWHQSLRSTEYFSKYIEAKERQR
jgi:hypothetical protein